MAVLDARMDLAFIDRAHRVQRNHHGLLPRQGLQAVEQVMQADAGLVPPRVGRAFVVPGGPGRLPARQHAGIGVQNGLVGLVADGAQHAALLWRGIAAEQAQGLVAVAGQHHGVERLRAVRRLQQRAVRGAAQAQHGRIQARLVAAVLQQRGHHAPHVLARAAAHRVPLRPVRDLDQSMVVAKADQRGHGKAQHLVGGAGPDAAHHGQQVVLTEGGAKAVVVQKIADGAAQPRFIAFLGDARGQAVEAQDLGQHLQKARAQQIAPLREHAAQRTAAPFQARAAIGLRHLHGKRHLGGSRGHLQLLEQTRQQRIGAVVEDQKSGVHALAHAAQRQVHRVGVPPEMAARLQQGHGRPARRRGQAARCGQPRNPRTDDSNAMHGGALLG